jgi:hypothetical protein
MQMHEQDEVMLNQDEAHEQGVMVDEYEYESHAQDAVVEEDEAHARRWRRWISGRCYCTYPIPVCDPARRPSHCERCGGFIPVSVIDTETNATETNAELIEALERENRILRVAFLVMTVIAAVAVYLYDKAVTGGMP